MACQSCRLRRADHSSHHAQRGDPEDLRHLKLAAAPPPIAPARVRQEAFAWSSARPHLLGRRRVPDHVGSWVSTARVWSSAYGPLAHRRWGVRADGPASCSHPRCVLRLLVCCTSCLGCVLHAHSKRPPQRLCVCQRVATVTWQLSQTFAPVFSPCPRPAPSPLFVACGADGSRPVWRSTELSPATGVRVRLGRSPSGDTGEVRGGASG